MKYWNKQKAERSNWRTVTAPKIHNIHQAKLWCQRNGSNGRFYFHYTNTRWWFENEQDALAFSLTWSGK